MQTAAYGDAHQARRSYESLILGVTYPTHIVSWVSGDPALQDRACRPASASFIRCRTSWRMHSATEFYGVRHMSIYNHTL